MARSEFSSLRMAVMKRISRLEKAGLAQPGISIPMAKDIRGSREKASIISAMKGFLADKETTVRGAKQSGKTIAPGRGKIPQAYTEKQLKGREKRERAKRRREEELQKLTNKQRGFLKGAHTIGINIPTSQIPVFVEYMEYRFSQIQDSQFYVFATYAEDFESASKKDPSGVKDILADYERYKSERSEWMDSVSEFGGYSEESVLEMWADFIDEL